MKTLSVYLQKLEDLEISEAVLRETKIRKVLKRIKVLDEIPRDAELKFKERATNLLDKYNAILFPEGCLATSSTAQPTNDRNMELHVVPDIQQHFDVPNGSHLSEPLSLYASI
jgi:hypothetical protein